MCCAVAHRQWSRTPIARTFEVEEQLAATASAVHTLSMHVDGKVHAEGEHGGGAVVQPGAPGVLLMPAGQGVHATAPATAL